MVANPITVKPSDPVYEAEKLMHDKRIGSVIVVDNGKVLGVFTKGDLVRRVLNRRKNPRTVRISEVMSSPIVSISPTEDVVDATQLIRTRRIRTLIVMEGEKLVGTLTFSDVIRNMKRDEQEVDRAKKTIIEPAAVTIVAQGDVVLGGKQTVDNREGVMIRSPIEIGAVRCESCGSELKDQQASGRFCPFCGADRQK